ncbi:sulfotransferase [Leptolyngbya cf. ectocarpi LEGE 11479]|uniref:Sulfotransferase n=1 Tax=Leptolyngbya cf. ectocarpi LEGE 11479 TaxID=1828722 RepID=A0A928ZTB8_LEPEC|nr:sulfotransferase [Leptolyngbya ectocarpi]MBE9066956.1 sulfotransferase [Leptolyngbya cf. ectocarpi LEGE 11479]
MKLNREFIKLPWYFDAEQLALEAQSFEESEWRSHPSDYAGNSAISLVSADGENNDDLAGRMLPTPQLQRCPYMQQVLTSFEAVIGRSRLMRLAPQCSVPAHFDSNYYWFRRTRIHIPILTEPSVRFVCNGKSVHMASGEAWIFDNWQTHEVIHNSDTYRIHLVFDTCGSASFWRKVTAVELADAALPESWVPFSPESQVTLMTEQAQPSRVADPSEVEIALQDLSNDVRDGRASLDTESDTIEVFQQLLKEHCLDWRSLWLLHGSNPPDYSMYTQLNRHTLTAARSVSQHLRITTNGASAFRILKLRLGAMVHPSAVPQQRSQPQRQPRKQAVIATAVQPSTQHLRVAFHKPFFIVAAPRSGSTLLFETLSQSQALWTVGRESHQHIESIDDLNPATRGYHSNQLTGADAKVEIAQQLMQNFVLSLQNCHGNRYLALEDRPQRIRFLEKTPKNALRIPFLRSIFPNAKFIFLHRQPAANISSIMEAWKSGRFVTYKNLPDWSGLPWSLLLPPGWQTLKQASLAEIAAFQWQSANQSILTALERLPQSQWCVVKHEDFIAEPRQHVQQLCKFMEIPFDTKLSQVTMTDLPHSRFTVTPPDPQKWRKNAAELVSVLPLVESLSTQLQALS